MSGDQLAVIGFLMAYAGAFGLGMVALHAIARWTIDNDMLWAACVVVVAALYMNAIT